MLILQRRVGERIRLLLEDDSVAWLTILSFEENRIRIGIDAPQEIDVAREELLPREERWPDGVQRKHRP